MSNGQFKPLVHLSLLLFAFVTLSCETIYFQPPVDIAFQVNDITTGQLEKPIEIQLMSHDSRSELMDAFANQYVASFFVQPGEIIRYTAQPEGIREWNYTLIVVGGDFGSVASGSETIYQMDFEVDVDRSTQNVHFINIVPKASLQILVDDSIRYVGFDSIEVLWSDGKYEASYTFDLNNYYDVWSGSIPHGHYNMYYKAYINGYVARESQKTYNLKHEGFESVLIDFSW